jgi:ribosomal protein S18 acetylase RimI-like enzyme
MVTDRTDTPDMEDSALVRLAQIVRVQSYKRRGDHGQTERVRQYVRKDLDASGIGKSLKGAFTDPERSEGFTYDVGTPTVNRQRVEPPRKPLVTYKHVIRPADNPHAEVVYAYDADGKEVGGLSWGADDDWSLHPRHKVMGIYVDQDHQRQGIATELWHQAKAIDPEIYHSDFQTDDGKAWVASLDAGSGEVGGQPGRGEEHRRHVPPGLAP